MRETAITAKLVKCLNALPNCFARKRHGSAYCSGDPDVHVVYKGMTIFIEVKMLEGTLSDLQALMLQRWQNAGATCVLAVWDVSQKAFALFINKSDWNAYIGPVKQRVLRNEIDCNTRYIMMQETLDALYKKFAD